MAPVRSSLAFGFAFRASSHLVRLPFPVAMGCARYPSVEPPVILPGQTVSADSTLPFGWTRLQRLGRQVPEFGGAFVDQDGVLTVHLTDLAAASRAAQEIRRELGDPGRALRFVRADYTYRQLVSFYQMLRPFLGQPGVSRVGVDERHNRLRIGVVDSTTRKRVEDGIAALGLPAGAFIIEDSDYAMKPQSGD